MAGASTRLARFGDRVSVAHATFRELPALAVAEPLAGALLDLGLSSRQIDDPARGMSFMAEGPLDLRMDPTRGAPASERLAHASDDAIADALRRLADVGPARRVARAIGEAARDGRLRTTRDLVRVVDRSFGGRPHPRHRARVFQALRMWLNQEADLGLAPRRDARGGSGRDPRLPFGRGPDHQAGGAGPARAGLAATAGHAS